MSDYFTLGPVPSDEDCAQVGDENFRQRATLEMNAYINQLRRLFPDAESSGVRFIKQWFNHDFGSYGEVTALYNTDEGFSAVLNIELNLPSYWDDEAREELFEK